MRQTKPEALAVRDIVTRQTNVGVEVEKLRVGADRQLSCTPFPCLTGAAASPYVQREFFTAQLEFALPPDPDVAANLARCERVITAVTAQLAPGEKLWPYSCPPPLPAQPTVAVISPMPAASLAYRQALSAVYDIRRLMNMGVHLNVSFRPGALAALTRAGGFASSDELYVQLAQQFMLHRWVFTYLFGATPVCLPGYLPEAMLDHPVRSLRSSVLGFPRNVEGDYRSVGAYVTRIEKAVARGQLQRASQYYEVVRLKSGAGKAASDLLAGGVTYVEVRAFDLNPFSLSGITAAQLRLVQVLAVAFALRPRLSAQAFNRQLRAARQLNDVVALERPDAPSACQKQGRALMTALAAFAGKCQLPAAYQATITAGLAAFQDSAQTLADRVWTRLLAEPDHFGWQGRTACAAPAEVAVPR